MFLYALKNARNGKRPLAWKSKFFRQFEFLEKLEDAVSMEDMENVTGEQGVSNIFFKINFYKFKPSSNLIL